MNLDLWSLLYAAKLIALRIIARAVVKIVMKSGISQRWTTLVTLTSAAETETVGIRRMITMIIIQTEKGSGFMEAIGSF
jgi:hypothetical protein